MGVGQNIPDTQIETGLLKGKIDSPPVVFLRVASF